MNEQRIADLDQLDLQILRLYQRDTQTPAHLIAERVGLSAAAVQRRLKRMRETGAIQKEIAQIDPQAVGLAVTCIVSVDIERERHAHVEQFARRMQDYPEVQQCYFVTGQTDFILVVLARDMDHYKAFTGRALSDENVRSFTTHVVLERSKVGLTLPLDSLRRE
jgi:Lrp/AsnC family transcriptional regulator, leucine-responsive regulatory protein